MPTIRVDEEVNEAMKSVAAKQLKPFTSPNNVLRFVLGLDEELSEKRATRIKTETTNGGGR